MRIMTYNYLKKISPFIIIVHIGQRIDFILIIILIIIIIVINIIIITTGVSEDEKEEEEEDEEVAEEEEEIVEVGLSMKILLKINMIITEIIITMKMMKMKII